MTEFMAAAAQYDPESLMSLEEVETAMVEIEQHFIRLYQRYCELNTKNPKEDKRKQFNPIRDMKISVSRAYQWAKRAECDADAARVRVIVAINQSLKKNREEESILWKLLLHLRSKFSETTSDSTIPDSVMNYINLLHTQYNLTEAEKKAIKKSGSKKKTKVSTLI